MAVFVNTEVVGHLYLKQEKENIQAMRHAVQQVRDTVKRLNRILEEVKPDHDEAIADPKSYVGNPVNCFKLIKRLVIDFVRTYHGLKMSLDNVVLANIHPDALSDLTGVFNSINEEERYANILKYGDVEVFNTKSGLLGDEIFLFYMMNRFKDIQTLSKQDPQLSHYQWNEGIFKKVLEKTNAMEKSNKALYDSESSLLLLTQYF
ncbi:hypothetical protein M8J75_010295 [Diaphorina citri]|nr:hypothetical protein M8J75_010295 [Diaphorina citri]